MLRQKREEADLTQKELAAETSISVSRIRRYEAGETPVPVPELEALGRTLNYPVRQFTIHSGPVGDWISEQRAIQDFLEMPPELQEFVTKPINRPYVELAQRLSEMSVDKLREVAEGLLEITL
jgi:transcriptional regulator with XRE-family HTH domain